MLTISRLAEYAGVTVRTIRHYHQIGLLPEPRRDALGYRSYGSDDVVRLVRIRALTAAGVPLARVGELLAADRTEFAATISEVDAALADRIAELEAHRRTLARMSDPDGGVLGPNAVKALDLLESWLGADNLRTEREAAVLMAALYPDQAEEWMAWQVEALQDQEVRELYRLSYDARTWDADDPRIEGLARRTVELTMRHYPVDANDDRDWWTDLDATAYRLIDQHGGELSSGWKRLTSRIEELMREAGYVLPDDRPPAMRSTAQR